MLLMTALVPLTMIGFGSYFIKKAPGKINWWIGYRTYMSMINKDTWDFAHHYAGRIWRTSGSCTLLFSVIVMLFQINKDTDIIGKLGGVLMLFQCIPLIAVIPFTEKALRKNFDDKGNRKQNSGNME